MLLDKVDLLESQTRQYKKLINNYEQSDSLKESIIVANREYYESVTYSLNEQLKSETRKKRLYKVGWLGTIGAAVAAFFLIK